MVQYRHFESFCCLKKKASCIVKKLNESKHASFEIFTVVLYKIWFVKIVLELVGIV